MHLFERWRESNRFVNMHNFLGIRDKLQNVDVLFHKCDGNGDVVLISFTLIIIVLLKTGKVNAKNIRQRISVLKLLDIITFPRLYLTST